MYWDEDNFWNLGMVKINASMSEEDAVDEVNTKLEDFRLSLEEHIVSCVIVTCWNSVGW